MRGRSTVVVAFFAILLAVAPFWAQTPAAANAAQGAVPRLIRFNGTLAEASMKQGGLVGVEFSIYKDESGGVALWSEIQNVEPDSSGHFTVLLGSTKNGGLAPDVLGIGEPRWLTVTPVGGQAQAAVLLVSVPYALRAEEAVRIAGASAGELVRKGDLTDSVREAMRTIQSDGANVSHPTALATGPTTFSGSTTNQIVVVQQTGTGKGLVASAPSAIGTFSTGGTAGVYGSATTATGVGVQGVASSTAGGASIGVSGISASAAGTGVAGKGSAFGVTGAAANAGGIGVKGTSTDVSDITGIDFGVQGIASNPTGAGVQGRNLATTGASIGVLGTTSSPSGSGVQGTVNAPNGYGVFGLNTATTGPGFGISGGSNSTSQNATAINGFEAAATGQVYGINGNTNSTGPFAAAVNGFEGAATGQVFGVNGGTNSTTTGSAGVNGGQGATTGTVYGVAGNALSSGQGSAGVSGYEGSTTGQVFGVNGGTNSAGNGSAGVNGFEGAATGNVFGVSGGTNSTGGGSSGVIGNEGATTGQVYGVFGGTQSTGNGSAGVNGYEGATSGNVFGVSGTSMSANGIGVNGNNNATTGPTIGVQGSSISPQGYGLSGTSPNVAVAGFNQNCNSNGCTLGTGIAGQFYTSPTGTLLLGLTGTSFSTLTPVFTVDGTGKGTFNGGVSSTINNPNGNAIVATNNATSGSAAALVGISQSPAAAGLAAYNYSTTGGGAVYAEGHSASGSALFANNMAGGLAGSFAGGVSVTGNLNVTGTITGSVKNFRIDNPLDPERKYLTHASIESSEMANIYSGNVVLDRRGEAVVDLPEWFEALNGDFRYQLTTIGRAAPVYIAKEIENHQFKISGGRAGMKVSWQVTGVRHDAWAQEHPMQVEGDKAQH